MKKVLYPGSFDPITNGHINIIEQASALFDEIVIAVLSNPEKHIGMFDISERVQMIKEIYKDSPNIKVVSDTKATIDVCLAYDCKAIIRGLRSLSDFDYEIQLSQINKHISNNKVNTICLFADLNCQFISSSMVKELLRLDKDITRYVHPIVKHKLIEKNKSFK